MDIYIYMYIFVHTHTHFFWMLWWIVRFCAMSFSTLTCKWFCTIWRVRNSCHLCAGVLPRSCVSQTCGNCHESAFLRYSRWLTRLSTYSCPSFLTIWRVPAIKFHPTVCWPTIVWKSCVLHRSRCWCWCSVQGLGYQGTCFHKRVQYGSLVFL